MMTAIEIISIGILRKQLEETKVGIGIKLILQIKKTKKVLLRLHNFRREIQTFHQYTPSPLSLGMTFRTNFSIFKSLLTARMQQSTSCFARQQRQRAHRAEL